MPGELVDSPDTASFNVRSWLLTRGSVNALCDVLQLRVDPLEVVVAEQVAEIVIVGDLLEDVSRSRGQHPGDLTTAFNRGGPNRRRSLR